MMIIDIGSLSEYEVQALQDVATGRILFHNGLWGADRCYMWTSDEWGRGVGRLPPWENETLDRLIRRQLVAVAPACPSVDAPVVIAGQDPAPPPAA